MEQRSVRVPGCDRRAQKRPLSAAPVPGGGAPLVTSTDRTDLRVRVRAHTHTLTVDGKQSEGGWQAFREALECCETAARRLLAGSSGGTTHMIASYTSADSIMRLLKIK